MVFLHKIWKCGCFYGCIIGNRMLFISSLKALQYEQHWLVCLPGWVLCSWNLSWSSLFSHKHPSCICVHSFPALCSISAISWTFLGLPNGDKIVIKKGGVSFRCPRSLTICFCVCTHISPWFLCACMCMCLCVLGGGVACVGDPPPHTHKHIHSYRKFLIY